jgi:ABC-type nitrate/sulfonate/bicarbonate transport system substrate-binding protein
MQRTRIVVLLAAFALLAAACGDDDSATTTQAPGSSTTEAQTTATEAETTTTQEPVELETVRFQNCVSVQQVAIAPLMIGGPLGFFEEEGIGELAWANTGAGSTGTCVQLTAAGQADITSPAPESLFNSLNQGVDPGVTCGYNLIRHPIVVIAVDPDGPVQSHADLEGKTIGAHDIASAFIPVLEAALVENGVDPDSVAYENTGFGAQAVTA